MSQSTIKLLFCAVAMATLCGTVNAEELKQEDQVKLNYFKQHLDEANKTRHACLAKGVKSLAEQERKECSLAQIAWEFQPYKPKPGATFSSSGGTH